MISVSGEGNNPLLQQLTALCRLLEEDGHMTPVATRQILKAVESHG